MRKVKAGIIDQDEDIGLILQNIRPAQHLVFPDHRVLFYHIKLPSVPFRGNE